MAYFLLPSNFMFPNLKTQWVDTWNGKWETLGLLRAFTNVSLRRDCNKWRVIYPVCVTTQHSPSNPSVWNAGIFFFKRQCGSWTFPQCFTPQICSFSLNRMGNLPILLQGIGIDSHYNEPDNEPDNKPWDLENICFRAYKMSHFV